MTFNSILRMFKFADMEEQYAKDKQLKREDIAKLTEWQMMQPHLPAPIHPIETTVVLQGCSYSNEEAKQRIDAYYTFRTHCPDLFAYADPLGPELQLGLDSMIITDLPKLTIDGHIVLYVHFADCNPNVFNVNTMWKIIYLISMRSMFQRGCPKGIVAIFNLDGVKMGHIFKTNIMSLKNIFNYLQNAAPAPTEAIHFVNCVPFTDKVLALIKPFLGRDYKDKINVHFDNNATIFEYVPEDILPIECGGASFCAKDYYTNVTRKEFEGNGEFFKSIADQLVDESKRPDELKHDIGLFGIGGTFKQLDIA